MKKIYSAFSALLFATVVNCATADDKIDHSLVANQLQASQLSVRDGKEKGKVDGDITEEGCPICKIHYQCLTGVPASNCASAKVSCERCLNEKNGSPNPKNPKNIK